MTRITDEAKDECITHKGLFTLAEVERKQAEAISSAADAMCNQWNCLDRLTSWHTMTPHFQEIWKNLKGMSEDMFKSAEQRELFLKANKEKDKL